VGKQVNKIEVKCSNCGNTLLKYKSQLHKTKNHFCNVKCKGVFQKGKQTPITGKKMTKEQLKNMSLAQQKRFSDPKSKESLSKGQKKRYEDPEQRRIAGNSNRGKTLGEEARNNMSTGQLNRTDEREHSEQAKINIGIGSKAKWTRDFKLKFRKIMEANGVWIPLNKKDDYKFYFELGNWPERMFNYLDCELLNELGVYNSYTNTKGVVRDHIYSRRSGFENGVFPEILRHPCNCQLLTHGQNISKKKGRYKDKDNQTLNELFDKIIKFKDNWFEQTFCLELISKYKQGEKYNKNEYIKQPYI
jgi:hypothetical protein